MLPWDNSTEGPIKSNKTRNAIGEMIGQLIRKVWIVLFRYLKIWWKFSNKIIYFFIFKEVDAALGPFVISFERLEHIGMGGLMGIVVSTLLVRYPSDTEKSVYATVEPFDYTVDTIFH